MSDDSSSEEAVVAKATGSKQKEKAKTKAKPAVEPDSDSEDDAPPPPSKKKPVVDSDSDDEVPAPKKPKKTTAVTQKAVADDSDSEEVAPKKKAVTKAVVESDSDEESPPPRPPQAASAKAKADSSDDSDEEPPVTVKLTNKATVVDAGSDDSEEETAKVSQPDKKQPQKVKAKLDASSDKPKQSASSSSKLKGEDELDELRVFVTGLPFKKTEDVVRKEFAPCGKIKHVKVLLDQKGRSTGSAFITFESTAGVTAALAMNGKKHEDHSLKVVRARKYVDRGQDKKEKKKEEKKKKQSSEEKPKQLGSDRCTSLASLRLDENSIINEKLILKLVQGEANKDFRTLEALALKLARRAEAALKEIEKKKKAKTKRWTAFVKGLPVDNFDEDAFRKRFEDCGAIKFLWLPMKSATETKGYGTITFHSEEAFKKALAYDGTKSKGNTLSVRVNNEQNTPKKERAEIAQSEEQQSKKVQKDKRKEDPQKDHEEKKQKRKAEADGIDDQANPAKKSKNNVAKEQAEEPSKDKKEKKSKKDKESTDEVADQNKTKKSKK